MVDDARGLSILDIAHRLGCGEPQQRGKELRVRCPLHEDRKPSLRIVLDGRDLSPGASIHRESHRIAR